jgi:hypothetical protein
MRLFPLTLPIPLRRKPRATERVRSRARHSDARTACESPAAREVAIARGALQRGAQASRGLVRPPSTFNGAVLPIGGVETLIVVVRPWVLADLREANHFVVAFHERFHRTIVLAAQRADGAACFYGPAEIVRVLQALPIDLIPWRQLQFRAAPPRSPSSPRSSSGRPPAPPPQPRARDTRSASAAAITRVLFAHHRAGGR